MSTVMSVIIACRNGETTLGQQLDALAAQRVDVPWNVLICDNGSTDGSVALARSYADRLPGLTVLDASGQAGPGYARNVGVLATEAPLIAFCDADDEVATGWVAAMLAGLAEHRFVAGRLEAVKLNDPAVLRSRPLQQNDELQHSPFGPGLPHAGAGNMGVHRDAFLAAGGFDPAVGCLEDSDLCWRIQQAGVPLAFWPDAVVHVRLRSSLRGMWSQGRAYGAAAALLEHRYPTPASADAPAGDSASPAAHGRAAQGPAAHGRAAQGPAAQGRARRLTRAVRTVAGQRSLGGLIWHVGWHLSHRRGRRTAEPVGAVPTEVVQPHPAAAPVEGSADTERLQQRPQRGLPGVVLLDPAAGPGGVVRR